ncbi:Uncharacterised protein [Delftia tsuruhatensis]|nr:Uncharacterised protein [Delftia tsuruhatensis]
MLFVQCALGLGRAEFGENLAVGVLDARDHHRGQPAAAMGQAGIGVDHFQQRNGAAAQGQGGNFVQRALAHTQGACQARHAGGAHGLHDLGRDGVLGIGQRIAQRHLAARGGRGVGGAPDLAAGQLDFHGAVHTLVVGAGALLQGRAIDEGLEGRSRLAPRLLHMVVGVLREVAAAHPGQHLGAARVQSHQAGLHAGLVLAQLPHEGLVGQQGLERVLLAGLFPVLAGRLLARGAPGGAFAHQLLYQRVGGVPAVALAPGAVGHALQRARLARHGLVGPGLQARVDGGVHHQAVGVDVVVVAVGPVDQPLAQLLREVRGHALRLLLALEIDAHRALAELVELGLPQHPALDHLRQHRVAAVQRAVGVEHGVVVARALEHAHQRGAFQHRQPRGRLVEIGACRHLDAEGVVQEGHGVQIGLQDLVLGIERLDLEGRDRLLELAVERGRAADLGGVEVARQLLGEGRAALRVTTQRMDHRAQRAAPVHAVVFVEAVVFRGDQRLDHRGRYLVELHPLPVAALEQRDLPAVGAHDLGRLLQLGLADVADAGRERNQQQHIQREQQRQGGREQQPFAPRGPAAPPGQGGHALADAAAQQSVPGRAQGLGQLQIMERKAHVARRPRCRDIGAERGGTIPRSRENAQKSGTPLARGAFPMGQTPVLSGRRARTGSPYFSSQSDSSSACSCSCSRMDSISRRVVGSLSPIRSIIWL